MKFTTTLTLATFGLSATAASSGGGGGGVRGGVNFYEATATGEFENIRDNICDATSCDSPCGNATNPNTPFVDICDSVDYRYGDPAPLPCGSGHECRGCGGEGKPNAYYCKQVDETQSVDKTEQ